MVLRQKKIVMLISLTLATQKVCAFNPLQKIKEFIPEAPVILEAGACIGKDTEKMKNFWPEAEIHSFEPHPESFQKLSNRVLEINSPDLYIYNLALSDVVGTKPFYRCSSNPGASSIPQPIKGIGGSFIKPITVVSTTLDDWAKENNIDHIDFMWLDMEGHELVALKAGTNILKTVKAIYIEVSHIEIRVGAPVYRKVKKWLEQWGFKEYCKKRQNSMQSNATFIKSDLLS